ncbi:AI-2E family transporter [Oscillatoria sp. FACHB-1407]|uniref:AI-2E family transporter n=1 Tax=Oscillatoria sp. FACHB-1407 TaxID=2692847 RepID=UPI001685B948|nr:AI-2E family transporter [Oscillatoria sp. FACHB-1407]MBD2463004.1 AI-2E family transporter [Oscillatoria sp. FACHB-1407]
MKVAPEQRISFSISNLLLVLGTLLLLVILWQLRSLIVLLMISIVLAASIAPVVDWAEQWRIPRWLTVVLVYLGLIAGLTGVILIIGPTAFTQIEQLIRQLPVAFSNLIVAIENWILTLNSTRPELVSQLEKFLNVQGLVAWGVRSSQELLVRSYSVTTGIVGGVFSLILALFISGYMLSDSRTLINSLIRLFPEPWDERLAAQIAPISSRIGTYIRGRVLVSVILGIMTTLGLGFLGLSEFALGLGAIAAVTNLIPFLGPILGAVPALIVALSQGWWTLLWVLLLFVIIQNLETYVLDPLLVGASVGVHPLYQLLAVLGGTQVLGILGALIVPPWVAGAAVLLENLYLQPKLMAEKQVILGTDISSKPKAPV